MVLQAELQQTASDFAAARQAASASALTSQAALEQTQRETQATLEQTQREAQRVAVELRTAHAQQLDELQKQLSRC